MPELRHTDLLPLGADDPPYRLRTPEEARTVHGPGGRTTRPGLE